MVVIFLLGRLLLGGYFLYNAYNHFKNRAVLAQYAQAKGVPFPLAGVIVSGILLLLGGLSVLIGFEMILGMILLVVFLIPTTFMMHKFWKETDPMAKMGERINFMKNIALLGSLLMMIAMAYVFL